MRRYWLNLSYGYDDSGVYVSWMCAMCYKESKVEELRVYLYIKIRFGHFNVVICHLPGDP
jgi:hypothetical protein